VLPFPGNCRAPFFFLTGPREFLLFIRRESVVRSLFFFLPGFSPFLFLVWSLAFFASGGLTRTSLIAQSFFFFPSVPAHFALFLPDLDATSFRSFARPFTFWGFSSDKPLVFFPFLCTDPLFLFLILIAPPDPSAT